MARCRRCPDLVVLALLLASRFAVAQPQIEPAIDPAALPPAAAPLDRRGVDVDDFDLQVFGYLQAAAVFFDESSVDELDPSTATPLNDTRFLIRRARLGASARHRFAYGRVELDGNTVRGPTVRLISAFAGLWLPKAGGTDDDGSWPLVEGRIGLFRTPFGAEVQEASRDRLYLELSNMANALFPGEYDQGLEVKGQWRFLRYQLATMDGAPLGDRGSPGFDPTARRDFIGRVGVDVVVVDGARLSAGGSLLGGQGLSLGSPATKDSIQWRDGNGNGAVELPELQPIAGRAAVPSTPFFRSAAGADVDLRLALPLGFLVGDDPALAGTPGSVPPWELRLFGELVFAQNLDRGRFVADPVAVGRDLRELGFAVGVTQQLTRFGALGVRYDWYTPDFDAAERRAATLVPVDQSVSTLAVVVAWIPIEAFVLALELNLNDNHLGRDVAGTPARLADNRLFLRAQMNL